MPGIFAPVVTVDYNDFASALKQINSSTFGCKPAFHRDAKLILRLMTNRSRRLNCRDVPTFRIDHMPYGGTRFGLAVRLRDAIHEMTEPKLLVMNLR